MNSHELVSPSSTVGYQACKTGHDAERNDQSHTLSKRRAVVTVVATGIALTLVCLITSAAPDVNRGEYGLGETKTMETGGGSVGQHIVSQQPGGKTQLAAIPWDYSGDTSSSWAALSIAYHRCKDGFEQSPIDIERKFEKASIDFPPLSWLESKNESDKRSAREFFRMNQVVMSFPNGGPIMKVYSFSRYLESLPRSALSEINYVLQEIVIHTPSENMIDGKRFAAELQFVHKCGPDTKPSCTEEKTMILAVVMNEARENIYEKSPTFLHSMIGDMKLLESGSKNGYVHVESFDMSVVNEDLRANMGRYFEFKGSITTPPCSEGVTWYVLKDPLSISRDDLEYLQKTQGNNSREVQKVNGRAIFSI